MYYHPAEALESRHRAIARFVTLLAALVLLLLCLFLVVAESTVPPEDELIFEVQASIDFGNAVAGSRKVNNFQAPSSTPADAPPSPPKAEPKPVESKTTAPAPEPILTTKAPAEVKAPKVEQSPQPVKEAPPQPSPQPSKAQPAAPASPQPAKPQPKADPNALFTPGGSNDGDGDEIGNKGSPKSVSLGQGMGWGEGSGDDGGLGRRAFLGGPMPRYNAQEEGKFVIEVSIRPDGSVQNVRIVKGYAGQINIKKAVEEAIYQWKFSPVSGGGVQKVRLTYTFKLR